MSILHSPMLGLAYSNKLNTQTNLHPLSRLSNETNKTHHTVSADKVLLLFYTPKRTEQRLSTLSQNTAWAEPFPFFLSKRSPGPDKPPTSRTQNDIILRLSRTVSVHPLARDVRLLRHTQSTFPLDLKRRGCGFIQSIFNKTLSGRACRTTRRDVRTTR